MLAAKLLDLSSPTCPFDNAEQIMSGLARFTDFKMLIRLDSHYSIANGAPDFATIAGISEFVFFNEILYAFNIEILNTPHGKITRELFNAGTLDITLNVIIENSNYIPGLLFVLKNENPSLDNIGELVDITNIMNDISWHDHHGTSLY